LDHDVHVDLSEQLIELIPRLRRFACGLSGSMDRGDELVQIACERLLKGHERLRPDTRLDSWLYRVIRNLHIDAVRAESVRERGAEQLRLAAVPSSLPVNSLDSHLMLHEVQAAMQELSQDHREALMLICVEGLSYREAAEVLGVPMGTVTSRLLRARQALLKRLGDEDEESAEEAL
jgi:RNA polymerase sigma-70 factor (ECF subfamily)